MAFEKAREWINNKVSIKASEAISTEIQTQIIESIPAIAAVAMGTIIFIGMRKSGVKTSIKDIPGAITIVNNYYYGTERFGNDISSLAQAICDAASRIAQTNI